MVLLIPLAFFSAISGADACTVVPNTDHTGGALAGGHAESAEDCCAMCTAVASCVVGVFREGTGVCYLKHNIVSTVDCADCTAVHPDGRPTPPPPTPVPLPPPSPPPAPSPTGPAVKRNTYYQTDVTKGLVYAQGVACHDNDCSNTHLVDLTLDLYKPHGAYSVRPAVVLIHGGGYTGGDETSMSQASMYFASRGFVAITINYRLDQIRYTLDSGLTPKNWSFYGGPMPPLPDDWQGGYTPSTRGVYAANRDAKAAVRWLRSQAQNLNIDPNFVGAAGGSSGAQTVLGLASTFEWDFTTEMTAADDPTIGSIHADSGLSASILAGVSWAANSVVTDMKIFADGIPRWQSWNAPLALYRGTEDELMTQWSQDTIKAYHDASGVQCDVFPVPGESHNTLMHGSVDGVPILEHAYLWLSKAMGLKLDAATATIAV